MQWRLQLASHLLRTTDATLPDIASGRLRLRGGVQPRLQAPGRPAASGLARTPPPRESV